MDKDLLYRFFEGRASVEEMRLVKEWSEASEENSKLLRRERKLFNAIILSGRLEPSDGQTTLRKKRNHFVRELLKIASVVAITVGITAALFSIGEDKEHRSCCGNVCLSQSKCLPKDCHGSYRQYVSQAGRQSF